ncbi:hypothetical protein NGM10_07405 [Halorussus salilacus]|uniref:hypothetical protein n=1 Tax=Halorussus salilacus TaxID=2953750 RepID=UPI00209DB8FA|nr:hypothetical protein [Halorussus salilacus]USZ69549.1 hypothetical protein NGM10_07405 [Halorussus salilacus]
MLKTEPALYEVVGRKNNHLWLEVLEGGDQGIRVSVPVHNSEYGENLQAQVLRLSVGDVRRFVLESEDEGRPDWRICEIEGPPVPA